MSDALNVLIIEDSDDDVELLILELNTGNYILNVERVQNAHEFQKALGTSVWDVIVSDYSLPGFSALKALEILKESGKDIPFIIVSGTIGEDAAVHAMRAGAADFFAKNNVVRLIPAIEREINDANRRMRLRLAEARLQRKHDLEKLLQEVAIEANSGVSIHDLIQFVLGKVCEYTGIPVGRAHISAAGNLAEYGSSPLWHATDTKKFARLLPGNADINTEWVGQVIRTGDILWLEHIPDTQSLLLDTGICAGFAFPVLAEGSLAAVLEFFSQIPLPEDDPLREIIPQISAQIRGVIERDRYVTALRQSEERFRKLFQALPIPVIISVQQDSNGHTVIYTNDIYVPLLGMNLREYIGKSFPNLAYDGAEQARLLEHLASGRTVQNVELHARQANGQEGWILVSIQEITFDGQPALVTGFQDITARKEIEVRERQQRTLAEALRDTAEILLNSTLDLDSVLDKILAQISLVIPYDAACVMLVEDTSMVRMAHAKGIHRQYDAAYLHGLRLTIQDRAYLRTMYETERPMLIRDTQLYENWHKDLSSNWIRASLGAPVRIDGQIIGFLILDSAAPDTFSDVQASVLQAFADLASTAIQNANLYAQLNRHAAMLEEHVVERTLQLSEAKERVEAILNNSSDAIILGSYDGVIVQVNPAFYHLTGYDSEEILGHSLLDLVHMDDVMLLIQALDDVVNREGQARTEVVGRCKDGTLFDADIALAAILKQGQIQGVVCSIRDITARKQAEKEIRAALEKERELNELKSRFTSMVSHEFRTPLTVIGSSAGILGEYADRLSEERKQSHLGNIQTQIKHLVELLDDVLMLSRAENLELEITAMPLDLAGLCRELVAEIQQTARQHQIELKITGSDIKPVMDAKLMRQVVANLLSNAVKYSPGGGLVNLDLHIGDEHVLIRVKDRGIGIPENDVKRLFEAFHRAENVGNISGTGLGLPIVKRAVEAHRGTIGVDSKQGEGTTFTIRIPLV
jgi:PAS domain S-box-containing protein